MPRIPRFNASFQRMIGTILQTYQYLNGRFYSPKTRQQQVGAIFIRPLLPIEVFIDGGLYSYSMERRSDTNNREGLHFWGNRIEVKDLQVFSVESIW